VELLVVLCIMLILGSLSGRALAALLGEGTINKNASDFSQILTLARAYAMANDTYVRVAMTELPPGGAYSNDAVVVLCLYSSDGTTSGTWTKLNRVVALTNLTFNDSLKGATPDTSNDVTPDTSTISPMTISMPALSNTPLTFSSFVQFSPIGESGIQASGTASHIKIGCSAATDLAQKNPFILRLSGANGTITILRKENME
jgi:Tfp pilus assembly protein FimT